MQLNSSESLIAKSASNVHLDFFSLVQCITLIMNLWSQWSLKKVIVLNFLLNYVFSSTEQDKQTVIAVSQDWVPILDKVFGQKWCNDFWQIKEVTTSKEERNELNSASVTDMDSLIRETLMPSCLASQRKLELEVGQPPWLQVDDMEVVSLSSDTQGVPVISSTGRLRCANELVQL